MCGLRGVQVLYLLRPPVGPPQTSCSRHHLISSVIVSAVTYRDCSPFHQETERCVESSSNLYTETVLRLLHHEILWVCLWLQAVEPPRWAGVKQISVMGWCEFVPHLESRESAPGVPRLRKRETAPTAASELSACAVGQKVATVGAVNLESSKSLLANFQVPCIENRGNLSRYCWFWETRKNEWFTWSNTCPWTTCCVKIFEVLRHSRWIDYFLYFSHFCVSWFPLHWFSRDPPTLRWRVRATPLFACSGIGGLMEEDGLGP